MHDLIAQTRAAFDLRIVEMIENVLKIDAAGEVRKIFEAAEQGDPEAKEKIAKAGATGKAPSGFMVLDFGIVDAETKNALLTAQAAERTLRIVEEIEKLYDTHVPALDALVADAQRNPIEDKEIPMHSQRLDAVEGYYTRHITPANIKIPSFDYIGSENDPENLVRAQATHQLAAEYERNEKEGLRETYRRATMKVPDFAPQGRDYVHGFKAHAARSYELAAAILAQKGYDAVARDITDVVQSISYDKDIAARHMPDRFATNLTYTQNCLTMEVNALLDPLGVREMPYQAVNAQWQNVIALRAQQSLKCTS